MVCIHCICRNDDDGWDLTQHLKDEEEAEEEKKKNKEHEHEDEHDRLLAMCNYNTYDNSKSTATPLSQSAFVQM